MTNDTPDHRDIAQRVHDVFEHITLLHANQRQPLPSPSGLRDLDDMLVPTPGGSFTLIVSTPSMGRSATATRFFAQSTGPGRRLFFSIDLSAAMLTSRLLMGEGRVDGYRALTGHMNERDFERLGRAAGLIADQNWQIIDAYNMTADDIVQHATNEAQAQEVGMIVVDGLELLPGHDLDQGLLKLRALSRALRCAVVVTLPVSEQAVMKRVNHRPYLTDITISEVATTAADVIVGLYRDEMYNRDTDQYGVIELIVLKQKNGAVGTVRAQFHTAHIRLNDMAPEGV